MHSHPIETVLLSASLVWLFGTVVKLLYRRNQEKIKENRKRELRLEFYHNLRQLQNSEGFKRQVGKQKQHHLN